MQARRLRYSSESFTKSHEQNYVLQSVLKITKLPLFCNKTEDLSVGFAVANLFLDSLDSEAVKIFSIVPKKLAKFP